MKKLFTLLALTLSLSSFAKEYVSFTYFGNEGGRNSYYACDYVEAQAAQYLELFGATDIEVYCSGGIQPWSVQPVSLRASFNKPVLSGREAGEVVEIKGDAFNPACGVNTRMINEFLRKFDNISVVKKNDSCAFARTNYYYQLNIVR
jgi:hypothetical protein